jgi:hypothetical protein
MLWAGCMLYSSGVQLCEACYVLCCALHAEFIPRHLLTAVQHSAQLAAQMWRCLLLHGHCKVSWHS